MKTLLFLLFSALGLQSGYSQILFQKNYDPYEWGEDCRWVEQTPDDGYIVVSTLQHFSDFSANLLRVNEYGDSVWSRTFLYNDGTFVNSVKPLSGGDFIFCGHHHLAPDQNTIYLTRTDSQGNELWRKDYPDTVGTYGGDVIKVTGGGYLITCAPDDFVRLIRTDDNGNVIWEKKHFVLHYAGGRTLETPDGGFMVAGDSASRTYLLKTDVNGNKLWGKTLVKGSFVSMEITDDGGLIVSASKDSIDSSGEHDVYIHSLIVLRADEDGDSIWVKYFPHYLPGPVCQAADNGFFFVVRKQPYNLDQIDFQKLNTAGDSIFHDVIYNVSDPALIKTTSDSGNIILTRGAGGTSFVLIKTGADGALGTTPSPAEFEIRLFPNPATEIVSLELPADANPTALELELFDLTGKAVYKRSDLAAGVNSIEVQDLAKGIYLWKVSNSFELLKGGKVIIQ